MESTSFDRIVRAMLFTAIVALAIGRVQAEDTGASLCVDAGQARLIQERFKSPERNLIEALRKELGLSEAAVISALPASRAVGVAGSEFAAVWESLRAWPDAVVAIRSSGHVLEVHGPIHAGEPSKVSKYFNLAPEGPGLSGHLRPDLVSAIYAVKLPGRSGDDHGVIFYDSAGEAAFGVYVPAEHAAADTTGLMGFETTRDRMQKLRAACPGKS
jgi:putative heme utilization carrier protein HutX